VFVYVEKAMMRDDVADTRGVVFNIQHFSIQDGPGIRTTVFLKGCSLHCGWCSNPEALSPYPQIIVRDLKCIESGKCVEVCDPQAITFTEGKRIIHWGKCNQCMKCAEVCPSGAIEAVGKTMTVTEVLDKVQRDAGYYKRTGGGMTLSGGEALVQAQFCLELLREAKKRGLHTALDTTGNTDWETFDGILNFTDLVLYDLKSMNSSKHREATGVPNERILDNLRKAVAKPGTESWIRYPVIPQFNDADEDLEALCVFLPRLKPSVAKICLLPYHRHGELKYAALGESFPWQGVPAIHDERIEEFKKRIESHGFEVDVGR